MSQHDHRPTPEERAEPPTIAPVPAERARQGRIVLRTRGQRLIFILGLAGTIGLGILLTVIVAGS